MQNLTKYLLGICCCAGMLACSTAPGSSKSSKNSSKHKANLPKVPPKILPGGAGDNWRYLGTTSDKQVAVEINESSITKCSDSINQYQDRKTIINATNYDFKGLTPAYKYSLSWWELDCNARQYRISSTSIFDSYGKLLKSYDFGHSNPARSISSGGVADMQYNYVCQGTGRSIGY